MVNPILAGSCCNTPKWTTLFIANLALSKLKPKIDFVGIATTKELINKQLARGLAAWVTLPIRQVGIQLMCSPSNQNSKFATRANPRIVPNRCPTACTALCATYPIGTRANARAVAATFGIRANAWIATICPRNR